MDQLNKLLKGIRRPKTQHKQEYTNTSCSSTRSPTHSKEVVYYSTDKKRIVLQDVPLHMNIKFSNDDVTMSSGTVEIYDFIDFYCQESEKKVVNTTAFTYTNEDTHEY